MRTGCRVRIFPRGFFVIQGTAPRLSSDWYGWSGPAFDIRSISNGKSCLDWIRTWAEIKLHCRAAMPPPPPVARYARRNMCRDHAGVSREMPCACLPDSGVTFFIKCNWSLPPPSPPPRFEETTRRCALTRATRAFRWRNSSIDSSADRYIKTNRVVETALRKQRNQITQETSASFLKSSRAASVG